VIPLYCMDQRTTPMSNIQPSPSRALTFAATHKRRHYPFSILAIVYRLLLVPWELIDADRAVCGGVLGGLPRLGLGAFFNSR
jgi:hypothetical protein